MLGKLCNRGQIVRPTIGLLSQILLQTQIPNTSTVLGRQAGHFKTNFIIIPGDGVFYDDAIAKGQSPALTPITIRTKNEQKIFF